MAQTQVEIEVELSGTKKVEKGIKKIEGGLEGVGETGSKLTKVMGATNEKLGEGLESVGGAIGEVREAFGELGGSIQTIGKAGGRSFMSLIGPLGMLVSAGVAVYETFRLISGAAQEAEEAKEAMNAAASDLQSKLEMLAEKGVILSTKELQSFSKAVLESQIAKERIQFQFEKQKKVFMEVAEAQKELNRLTEENTQVDQENFRARMESLAGMARARDRLTRAYQREEEALKKLTAEQERSSKALQKAANQEKAFEKLSEEGMRKEALRLLALEKEINLIEKSNIAEKESIEQTKAKGEIESQYLKEKKAIEDASLETIRETIKQITERTKALNKESELDTARSEAIFKARRNLSESTVHQAKVEHELARQREEEYKKDNELALEQLKQEDENAKTRAAANQNRLRKEIALRSQLNQIEIKMKKEGNDQKLALEKERHRATLELIKKGTLEEQVEQKRHVLQLKQIRERGIIEKDRETAAHLQKISEAHQLEISLRADLEARKIELKQQAGGFGTEWEKLQFETEQRLALLKIESDREIALAQERNEDLTAIQKQFALERIAITQESTKEQIDLLGEYFDKFGSGFVEAGFNALFFGESFQEATAQILKGLAQQAIVEAAMQTAKGFSLIALHDPVGATAAFQSAALFAGAASVAGVASNVLGGGGTAGGSVSPSGSPSTAPAPEREQAEMDSMVFNINFGGAVIYDTKKAAEQALADRLVSIINTPRRGAVQLRRS
tara:strand:+ start:1240 stop:3453 length:2214 start_codon:yes stop_codon:yes gene_type:complete